jgi:hypothetical protein
MILDTISAVPLDWIGNDAEESDREIPRRG